MTTMQPLRRSRPTMPGRVVLLCGMLVLLAGFLQPTRARAENLTAIHVFFSAGCADCWPYVEKTLVPALRAGGLTAAATIHDYTRPGGRQLLAQQAAAVGLPRRIVDSLYAFAPRPDGGLLLVLGHVPPELLHALLSRDDVPHKLVIQQPKMHGTPKEYRLWSFAGEVLSFPIDTPLHEALPQLPPTPRRFDAERTAAEVATLLPTVVVSGLLDSVNPCAFAVILLLVAFLFTIRKRREQILLLGGIYIGMIFLVYLAIGFGLLQTIRLSENPHFVARVGSYLLIGLGVLNLIEYRWPRFPLKLHMPAAAHRQVHYLLKIATVPAVMGVGLIVGLCTFPCSGGVYVSIITLLNAKTTLGWGIAYLMLYNVLFVLPLMVILVAAGNRVTAKKWATWERQHALAMRLWFGVAMVGLGAVMLGVVLPMNA